MLRMETRKMTISGASVMAPERKPRICFVAHSAYGALAVLIRDT